MAKRIGDTWSALSAEDNKLWQEWEQKYMPMTGKADTVAGEMIRALDKLIYRFYNDGDMAYDGYGNETCNSSFRYLNSLSINFPDLYCYGDENKYEDRLLDGEILVFNYLKSHPELFKTPNIVDSRKASKEDYEYSREEDYDDYDDGDGQW